MSRAFIEYVCIEASHAGATSCCVVLSHDGASAYCPAAAADRHDWMPVPHVALTSLTGARAIEELRAREDPA